MDKIFIHGLQLSVIIGIYPHERNQAQPILLDIDLGVDAQLASSQDSLSQTIDYDYLINQIKLHILHTEFFLIETLAEYIAQFILKKCNIPWLRLCLTKPGAVPRAQRNTQKIGIIIERTAS
jgi:dihydroneopterin aldolase